MPLDFGGGRGSAVWVEEHGIYRSQNTRINKLGLASEFVGQYRDGAF